MLFFIHIPTNNAQNTLGTLLNNQTSLEGYTLISPRTNEIPRYTYLIDNCGEIVNQWESEFPLFGKEVLMPDGTLYRSVIDNQSTLNIPGITGRIERLDWEGNLIWANTYCDTDFCFHHDFEVLDNGNILLIVAERRSEAEAIENGRNPVTIANGELYEETIVEIEPIGQDDFSIIWKWSSWDHLIQDFDATKQNFGIISENPGLVDINYGIAAGEADWWHSNAISYSQEKDQIILSNRDFDEFIILDHSTTTEQAATNTGGNSNRGGTILYRFGNPEAYGQGTLDDRVLNAQHNVQFIPSGSPNAGNIMIFNNQPILQFSKVQIIDPEFDEETNNYIYDGTAYGPDDFVYEYMDPDDPSNFFAAFLSGAQELENGNILINSGPNGFLFEVNPFNNDEIVWEYQNPVALAGILEDGDNPDVVQTRLFRALRYSLDYPAFDGRDLTPQGVIELNPADFDCTPLSINDVITPTSIKIWPNPTQRFFTIQDYSKYDTLTLYDSLGRSILNIKNNNVDLSNFQKGIYFLKGLSNGNVLIRKIIKQ